MVPRDDDPTAARPGCLIALLALLATGLALTVGLIIWQPGRDAANDAACHLYVESDRESRWVWVEPAGQKAGPAAFRREYVEELARRAEQASEEIRRLIPKMREFTDQARTPRARVRQLDNSLGFACMRSGFYKPR
jgi:hypothetical protein